MKRIADNQRPIVLFVAGIAALVLAGAVGGAVVAHHQDGDRHMMRGWGHGDWRGHREWGERRGRPGDGRGFGEDGTQGGMMPGGGTMHGDGPPGPPDLLGRALRDHLGVTDDKLEQAMLETLDDMVTSGELDKGQAARIRERIKGRSSLLPGGPSTTQNG